MIISAVIVTSIIGALFLFINYCIKWRKRNYVYSLLPGPKHQHIFLGDIPILVGGKKDGLSFHVEFLDSLMNLTAQYRNEGLCRIWLANDPYVLLFSAETVETVFTSQTLITKSDEYNLLHCWLGTGLLTSTGKKWKERRRLITPTFHYRILDDFLPIFDAHSKTFVENMAKFVNKGPIDVVPHMLLLTLDIICETAMGINIGAQNAKANDYVNAIAGFADILMKRTINPWLKSDFILSCTKDGAKHKKFLKILQTFTSNVIKQRKEELLAKVKSMGVENVYGPNEDNLGRKKRQAFLDLLLRTQLIDNSITDEGIREEVDTFMFEGHDTTSAGISWTLYHLGRHPEIQQKAYEELNMIFGDDKNREITPQDLREMKYLECVLKESQRVSPSVPMFSRKASEDVNIKGYAIPRGSTLSFITYQLHRDPAVFPDPEVFDPDRFLPENSTGRHPFAYVPFSAGSRNCIGQKFAMMEMKVTVCNALRNFIFESVDPPESMRTSALLILRSENGIRLNITKRE